MIAKVRMRALWALIVLMLIPWVISCDKSKERNTQLESVTAIPETRMNQKKFSLPTYRPPVGAAPGGRLDAGTRVPEDIQVAVLAPDHTAWTSQYQPILYYYLSERSPYPIYLELVETITMDRLIKARISNPKGEGIHKVELRNYSIGLDNGHAYFWYVILEVDSNDPAKNLMTAGTIERVSPPPSLIKRLEHEDEIDALAKEGFWYDAFMAATRVLETSPNDQRLRAVQTSLISNADKRIVNALYSRNMPK